MTADVPALLLVDDRPENLLALEVTLAPLGHPMVRAQSGEAALRELLAGDFAVIVLDVQMPGMDGFETAAEIKQRERTRDIPIVFLTAISRQEEHQLRGFATGAVDYIFKPIEPELLRARVAVFVELDQRNRQLREQRRQLEIEVDERRRAEARLAEKTVELAESNTDLEQFSFIVSHDLQEPVRVVAGYLELLRDRLGPALDDTAEGWMDRVEDATAGMSQLLRDLLVYARARAGVLELAVVDLDCVLERACAITASATAGGPVDVRRAPLGTAMARERDLIEVFQNLIANAVKFRADDPLVIDVRAHHGSECVTISIADNGKGVDESDLERVFGMFERVRNGPHPGTGLGLAICRRIVERLGGRMWMERNPSTGVTVRLTLRAAP